MIRSVSMNREAGIIRTNTMNKIWVRENCAKLTKNVNLNWKNTYFVEMLLKSDTILLWMGA